MNCQAYVRGIGESIPPSRLPADTQSKPRLTPTYRSRNVADSQVIVIGCGTHQPIEAYLTKTSSPYPVYTNPSLSLYELFQFKSSLAGQGDGPTKDYMQSSGSYFTRVMGGVKGALGDMGNISNVGPKSQNGGEVIINKGKFEPRSRGWNRDRVEADGVDGECEYIYRMQNTVDHTSLAELASLLCLQGGK